MNLKRKQDQKDAHKKRSMAGTVPTETNEEVVDDDVAYYKSEVGHAPVDGILHQNTIFH